MKRILLILSLVVLFQACERQELALASGSCFEVSYVSGICGQAVLKIETPAFYHLGESWNGHDNVFLTMFSCEDDMLSKEGTFYVTLLTEPDPGDCARCQAAVDYSGNKNYPVKRVNQCLPPTDN